MQPLNESSHPLREQHAVESMLFAATSVMPVSPARPANGEDFPGFSVGKEEGPPVQRQSWLGGLLGAIVIAGALIWTTFDSLTPTNDETVHANWSRHVAEITEINRAATSPQLKFVNRAGRATFVSDLTLSAVDEDHETTQLVRKYLERGEIEKANQALQDAQNIPHLNDAEQAPLPRIEPNLTPGMQGELTSNDARFYRIYLWDSCDEDGDVVKILLNGVPFAVVPITNAGVTLSVPVGTGTIVSLEGVHDGMGGITVACRTSQGDYFTSAMPVGAVQAISIVQ